jgi:hypothetical protein
MVCLMFGDLEEGQRVSQTVPLETFGPQDGICKGDRDRRVVGADEDALGCGLVFDLVESVEAAGGLPFEKLDPTIDTLLAGQAARGLVGSNIGYATELI